MYSSFLQPAFTEFGFLETWWITSSIFLDFAEINGIIIPEIYYLLGVVYNEVAHLKNYVQNNSPLINKLENMTIKTMIKKVFEWNFPKCL